MHEGERVTAAVLTVNSVKGREVVAASFVLTTNGRFRVLNIHHAAPLLMQALHFISMDSSSRSKCSENSSPA